MSRGRECALSSAVVSVVGVVTLLFRALSGRDPEPAVVRVQRLYGCTGATRLSFLS
jgi:hypothetical protein